MGIRIDGNNDLINAADGTLTVEGISVNVVGVSTASGGFKVGTAYTVFPNGNVAAAGVITATSFSGDGSGLTGVASTDNISTGTTANMFGGLRVGTAASVKSDGSATFAGIATAASFKVGDGGPGADEDRFAVGAGEDLKIYHDGNSVIYDNGTGNLKIYSNGGAIQLQKDTGENMIVATTDGSVALYHNNIMTLETGAGGNQSIKSGANTFNIGSSDAGGAHIVLDGDSNGDGSGADYCGISHETSGNMLIYQDNPNSNGQIDFNTGGSSRVSMQSDKFRASNDNAMTLGTSGLAWSHVFTKGNYVVNGSGGTGVDFAHGASAGTAANILDEYEEGTWTPGFYPMSSAMTLAYSLQTGTYRRIGNVVYWAFRVRLSALSGQMGQNMGFGGFPYNVDSSQPQFSANIYGQSYNGEIPDSIFYQGNVNRGDLYYPTHSNGATRSVLQASDCNPTDSYTVGTGFYFAA